MPRSCSWPQSVSIGVYRWLGFFAIYAFFCGELAGLQSFSTGRIVWRIGMKAKANGQRTRVNLGRHIVADSGICGGQPTFKGTRIMVWIVLEQLERGLTWTAISHEWDGRVTDEAIAECFASAASDAGSLDLRELIGPVNNHDTDADHNSDRQAGRRKETAAGRSTKEQRV